MQTDSVTPNYPPYCVNYNQRQRLPTRTVDIGGIPLGAAYPIRIQSMTTTPTLDIQATAEQVVALARAGCDYVRITAPNLKAAEALAEIQKEVRRQGCQVPLIADIHYTPKAAEIAARIVAKVRINPGNYVGGKHVTKGDYSPAEEAAELERIHAKLRPLLETCHEYGTALRIGVNHGSLAERIMNRYGDTPEGMVESAWEFIEICRTEGFHNLVISLKASNPVVMVAAYRLLAARMLEKSACYPLHLGVTEAGSGLEGRVKSAVGIGALLADGLGDTIRVSLTENPLAEVPVARQLLAVVEAFESQAIESEKVSVLKDPYHYQRRPTKAVGPLGGSQPVRVFLSGKNTVISNWSALGYSKTPQGNWQKEEQAVEFLDISLVDDIPSDWPVELWGLYRTNTTDIPQALRIITTEELPPTPTSQPFLLQCTADGLTTEVISKLNNFSGAILLLEATSPAAYHELRRAVMKLVETQNHYPVVFKLRYADLDENSLTLAAAAQTGGLLLEGFGDGIWLEAPQAQPHYLRRLTYQILQAARVRITTTEFIACPSCGRTLFDLEKVTALVKSRLGHLKGLKIAVMGCIVNGPGEMADADYGYVGAGPGLITLYKGHEIVARHIPESQALERLVEIIKLNGDWKEPA